jgi:hypothetical protein
MKHIILISIDNLRFDCAGYQPDKKELVKYDVLKYLETPTLDRIAEKSLCFTECISTNSYTTAAHASILTGLYPPGHGVRGFYDKKLSRNVYTLAEVLKPFGYETAMMTDTATLFQPPEIDRGFDHFFHIDEEGLLKLIEEKREGKLFVFAHFYDVHEPFLLSKNPRLAAGEYVEALESLYEKYRLKMGSAGVKDFKRYRKLWLRLVDHIGYKSHETFFPLYVRGVSRFDRGRLGEFIGRLDSLGLLKDSLLVVISDHGEGKSLPENPDNFTHGGRLYDSVVRVPLMIRHEDFSHRLMPQTVSVVDIFPTIIRLATGQKADDLLPYDLHGLRLDSPAGGGDRFVYSENWCRDAKGIPVPDLYPSYYLDQRSLRSGSRKFTVYGEPECLDTPDAIRVKDTGAFIQDVYRGLLYRFEGFWEYLTALEDLEDGKTSRDRFLDKAVHSLEYRSKDRYVMCDLRTDPFEENPVRIADRSGAEEDAKKCFDTIRLISRDAAQSDDIFPDNHDAVIEIVRRAFPEDWEEKARIFVGNKHLMTCLIGDFLLTQKGVEVKKKKQMRELIMKGGEFSSFFRRRLSGGAGKTFLVKKTVTRYISFDRLNKLYFLLMKLFPRQTRRGRLWHRLFSGIRNS